MGLVNGCTRTSVSFSSWVHVAATQPSSIQHEYVAIEVSRPCTSATTALRIETFKIGDRKGYGFRYPFFESLNSSEPNAWSWPLLAKFDPSAMALSYGWFIPQVIGYLLGNRTRKQSTRSSLRSLELEWEYSGDLGFYIT